MMCNGKGMLLPVSAYSENTNANGIGSKTIQTFGFVFTSPAGKNPTFRFPECISVQPHLCNRAPLRLFLLNEDGGYKYNDINDERRKVNSRAVGFGLHVPYLYINITKSSIAWRRDRESKQKRSI